MYIKKYLTGYGLVSVGIPICIYLAAICSNDKIRSIFLSLLIVIAVVVVSYSKKIIKFIFFNRENYIIDTEFVTKMNCFLVIVFCLRYLFINILATMSIYNTLIIHLFMSPIWIFIAIPFMKNFCINIKTIVATLIMSIVLIYAIFPLAIFVLTKIFNDDYFAVEGVYYNYFAYNMLSNRILAGISGIFGITISDGLLFPILQIVNIVVWSILYMPYIVITALVVDERSYMNKGGFVSIFFVILLMGICLLSIFGVFILSADGIFKVDYAIFHNI